MIRAVIGSIGSPLVKNRPDWFDRRMYFPCEDPIYWRLMISSRLHLLNLEKGSKSAHDLEKAKSRFRFLIETTKNQAKSNLDHMDRLQRSLANALAKPSVFPMRYSDLEHLSRWSASSTEYQSLKSKIESLKRDGKPHYWRQRKNAGVETRNLSDISIEFLSLRKTPLTSIDDIHDRFETPAHTPVLMNLSKPLDELMADIRELKAKTDDAGRLLKDLKKEFKSWHKFGVLPYFDLRIWGRLYRVRITNQEIQDLIWPPEGGRYINEEVLKKTTSKYVKKVISKSTLDKL